MRRRVWVRLAWVAAAISGVLAIGAGVLLHLNRSPIVGEFNGATIFAGLVIPILGALLVAHRPRNPIGWLYIAAGLTQAITIFSGEGARYTIETRPGSLPAGPLMSWLAAWLWAPGIGVLLTFSLLLFPDGQLLSRRWRPVAWLAGICIATLSLPLAIVSWRLRGPILVTTRAEDFGGDIAVALTISFIGSAAMFVVAMASVVSLWVRLRRAQGDEREQVKWFLFGAAVFVVGLLIDGIVTGGGNILSLLVTPAPPVAAAIAIFKYRLYDIEVVIGKTVVLGALVAFITVVYMALVVGVGTLAGGRGNVWLSAVAAALVAVAFQPVRARARRLAGRLVYGKRATPYEVLSELSERMAGTLSVEDILPRMAAILAEGTGATRSAVWLRVGRTLRRAAGWPPGDQTLGTVELDGEDLPGSLGFDRALPVRHQGELLGAVTVTKAPGDPITPAEEKLLADLASQAGLVLRNARLIEELRASRQRLVAAQDEERRRIERNIHDGAQQQLVALAVKLNLAGSLAERDPTKARAMIDQLKAEATDALDNLRDLARGIYPPLLADRGLLAALAAQAQKAPLPVTVDADGVGRYPQEVEAAVYFCCLEALQNMAKYAHATSGAVRLGERDGHLTFEVADDGRGFDSETTPLGSGLQNMADRLASLGGSTEISSRPGSGTTVRGRIPVAAETGATRTSPTTS